MPSPVAASSTIPAATMVGPGDVAFMATDPADAQDVPGNVNPGLNMFRSQVIEETLDVRDIIVKRATIYY